MCLFVVCSLQPEACEGPSESHHEEGEAPRPLHHEGSLHEAWSPPGQPRPRPVELTGSKGLLSRSQGLPSLPQTSHEEAAGICKGPVNTAICGGEHVRNERDLF